jgi:hypothetical protein
VASRISRILTAIDASPTTTKLGAPTTDWLHALAPAVKLAPLRALMQGANNWVRRFALCCMAGWLCGRERFAKLCSLGQTQAGLVSTAVRLILFSPLTHTSLPSPLNLNSSAVGQSSDWAADGAGRPGA